MDIWKIEPFDLPSTDRTQPPKQIVGIELSYWGGKVAVSDLIYSPVTLIIDYYDNEGRKRDYLQDRVDADVIRSKAVALGKEGAELEGFVKYSMDIIVKSIIGGGTIHERRDALAQMAQLFGQVVLPAEAQNGLIN
jgi:hypothetical protein